MPSNALSTISKLRVSSSDVARQWLVKFAEICQREFTPALAEIWADQLRDIAPDLLERSCDRLMKKWSSGFLPVPGNIRELADQELRAAEREELQQREEQERRAALVNYERAIAYAEYKQQQRLLGPPPGPVINMTDARPVRRIPCRVPHVAPPENFAGTREGKLFREWARLFDSGETKLLWREFKVRRMDAEERSKVFQVQET